MTKLPILARNVCHLTDARYFAALEADYIVFNLDPSSPDGIDPMLFHGIVDWVAGSTIAVEMAPDGFDQKIHRLSSDSTSNPQVLQLDFADIQHAIPQVDAYIINLSPDQASEENLQVIDATFPKAKVYIQCELTSILITTLLSTFPTFGIVLLGSAEEKTGIKSYADLDEILDLIELD